MTHLNPFLSGEHLDRVERRESLDSRTDERLLDVRRRDSEVSSIISWAKPYTRRQVALIDLMHSALHAFLEFILTERRLAIRVEEQEEIRKDKASA